MINTEGAFAVPASALTFGFVNELKGTHTSRTMMLAELRTLLDACPATASISDYRAAVVYDNALLKKTATTRLKSYGWLRQLYSLDRNVVLFRALRDLWNAEPNAQPLVALLCALARDTVLQATANVILETPVGSPVTPQDLSMTVSARIPDHYNETTLRAIGQNTASTWQQSGHLSGKLSKVRSRADCHPASVAYALLLGHLCGAQGEALFGTLWSRLLDAPHNILHEQAAAASRHGWIDYRHSGNVTEIGFSYLLRDDRKGHEA